MRLWLPAFASEPTRLCKSHTWTCLELVFCILRVVSFADTNLHVAIKGFLKCTRELPDFGKS